MAWLLLEMIYLDMVSADCAVKVACKEPSLEDPMERSLYPIGQSENHRFSRLFFAIDSRLMIRVQ
jgi:hypothetical protein